MTLDTAIAIAAIGAGVGFLGGLFGKGGSAIATPLLALVGIPAIVAVASPLPATIPSTAVAAYAFWRERQTNWSVVTLSLAFGIPATALGAFLTRWIAGDALVMATELLITALGVRFFLFPSELKEHQGHPGAFALRLSLVAIGVGLVSGLLGNSGGFLLAPAYVLVLRLPIKQAFATSLAIASVLAIPGTIVHASLGHIDWAVVLLFGAASIPLSYVGARVALRTNAVRLERIYGIGLAILGPILLIVGH